MIDLLVGAVLLLIALGLGVLALIPWALLWIKHGHGSS